MTPTQEPIEACPLNPDFLSDSAFEEMLWRQNVEWNGGIDNFTTELTADRQAYRTELSRLRTALSAVEAENERLRGENDHLEGYSGALGAHVDELEAEIERLRGIIEATDANYLRQTERLGLIPMDCDTPDALADEIESLRAENERLRQQAVPWRGPEESAEVARPVVAIIKRGDGSCYMLVAKGFEWLLKYDVLKWCYEDEFIAATLHSSRASVR